MCQMSHARRGRPRLVHEMALTIRPLDPERELEAFLRVRSLTDAIPVTPESWWGGERRAVPGAFRRPLIGEIPDGVVAAASVMDSPFLDDGVAVRLAVDPAHRGRGHGRAMMVSIEAFLAERRPGEAEAVVRDDDPASRAWAERRGFVFRDHAFPSRLDLERFDPAPHRPAVERAEAAGIRFEIAADLDRLYDLYLRLMRDVPDHLTPPTREAFERDSHRPGTIAMIAVDDERWVGMAIVLPTDPDGALNGFTGVLPECRGRGLARALKVVSAETAHSRGRRWIQTSNNALNAPMLAVNRALGYERQPGRIFLRRTASITSAG